MHQRLTFFGTDLADIWSSDCALMIRPKLGTILQNTINKSLIQLHIKITKGGDMNKRACEGEEGDRLHGQDLVERGIDTHENSLCRPRAPSRPPLIFVMIPSTSMEENLLK